MKVEYKGLFKKSNVKCCWELMATFPVMKDDSDILNASQDNLVCDGYPENKLFILFQVAQQYQYPYVDAS